MSIKNIYSVLLLISVNVLSAKSSWDIAVTLPGQIEFYSSNGTRVGVAAQQFNKPSSLTLDDVTNRLFFNDPGHDNGSIFSLELENRHHIEHIVTKSQDDDVKGIAFDPVTEILYWTNSNKNSIYYYSLAEGNKTEGSILKTFTHDERPYGIAVDICKRKLYWTNANLPSSIERSSLDGADPEILILDDIFTPLGIVIDQVDQRIYWVDDKEGQYFSIESADLEGKNRQIHINDRHHEPHNLAVDKDNIYWIDWLNPIVWMLPKLAPEGTDPTKLIVFENGKKPLGIVVRQNIDRNYKNNPHCNNIAEMIKTRPKATTPPDVPIEIPILRENYCLNGGELEKNKTCVCKLGYTGEYCETRICDNYCVVGKCRISSRGFPECTCPPGYTEPRCRRFMCDNFCMNEGTCTIEEGSPICNCPMPYSGRRCESNASMTEICEAFCKEGNVYASRENDFKIKCSCTINGGVYISSEETSEEIVDNTNATSEPLHLPPALQTARDCLTENAHNPFVIALAGICGIFICTTCMLVHKIYKVTRRPRIRKRIIVNKNITPLTCPPPTPSPQQCEITIENCCNMNICETPCFDPVSYRDPREERKSKKEEKKNLLSSMENPDDLY